MSSEATAILLVCFNIASVQFVLSEPGFFILSMFSARQGWQREGVREMKNIASALCKLPPPHLGPQRTPASSMRTWEKSRVQWQSLRADGTAGDGGTDRDSLCPLGAHSVPGTTCTKSICTWSQLILILAF